MENMMYLKQMLKLEELHKEIRKGHTGSPSNFAKKMHMSLPTLERKIDGLRSLGADISYDRILQTYRYGNNFTLQVIISEEQLQ